MYTIQSKGEKAFNIINNMIMFLIILIMLYPFVNQIAVSLSSNSAILAGKVSLWPVDLTLGSYKEIMADKSFLRSLLNTVIYTVLCTAVQVFMTTLFAYPLSKKHLKGRSLIMSLIIFSMMFGTGGLIPNYLLIKNLGLVDSYAALILPGAINIWNVIVIKNFFQQIPESLEEAARIDGAGIFRVFINIVLPLSLPVLAAITLFVAVASWNEFFHCMVYITTPEKKLLQVYLSNILQAKSILDAGPNISIAQESAQNPDSLKAAALMCTVLPIILAYPFAQKYFVSGLLIGSVKA